MNILLKTGMVYCFLSFSLIAFGQTEDKPILVTVENLERDYGGSKPEVKKSLPSIKNAEKDFYRHHKKLPSTYDGYLIELTTSDFPLKRDYHLFKQFGQVYYQHIKGLGYAYLIKADFSSRKSIEQYVENIIKHKAPEAQVFEYKKGKRID